MRFYVALMILISACGGAPKKPSVLSCIIDYPRTAAICRDPKSETPVLKRVDLQTLDKNMCFAPAEWEQIQNYIDDLESKLGK